MRPRAATLAAIALWSISGLVASMPIGTAAVAIDDLRYVANSGMLVATSGRRFLIDAPIRDGIVPYATSSPDERTRLEGATAPYAEVDAILVTHWHEDHFSAAAVAAHLLRSPRTLFISSPEVVERLRTAAPGLPASQTRAVLPAPGGVEQVDVSGVPVRVLRIRHNPSRRLPEQHVGFLIGSADNGAARWRRRSCGRQLHAAEGAAAGRPGPAAVLVSDR